MDLRATALALRPRLAPIRLVVLDVDGVLTDATILYVGGAVGWARRFSVHDGFGVKLLLRAGLHVAALSADDNEAMRVRLAMMGITEARYGSEDKLQSYLDLQRVFGVDDQQTLFVGDELYDVPLIERAGFGAAVPDACEEARQAADYVTTRRGGEGAVRELCDLLRHAQDLPIRLERP